MPTIDIKAILNDIKNILVFHKSCPVSKETIDMVLSKCIDTMYASGFNRNYYSFDFYPVIINYNIILLLINKKLAIKVYLNGKYYIIESCP